MIPTAVFYFVCIFMNNEATTPTLPPRPDFVKIPSRFHHPITTLPFILCRQLITLRVACVCPHNAATAPLPSTSLEEAAEDGTSGARGGCKAGGSRRPRGRRHALPPMVAVLKVWAPNESTAALLLEGAELRLHRYVISTILGVVIHGSLCPCGFEGSAKTAERPVA